MESCSEKHCKNYNTLTAHYTVVLHSAFVSILPIPNRVLTRTDTSRNFVLHQATFSSLFYACGAKTIQLHAALLQFISENLWKDVTYPILRRSMGKEASLDRLCIISQEIRRTTLELFGTKALESASKLCSDCMEQMKISDKMVRAT